MHGMSGPGLGSEGGTPARRDLSWLLGVGISLTALVVAVWGLDLEAFVGVLSGGVYVLLLPAYLLQLAGIAARARGWRSLLGPSVTFGRAFAAINEGYLLNNVLPFRLGELGRAYLVGHGSGIGASRALGSIVVERMVDVSIAVLSVLVTVPLFAPPGWATQAAIAVGLGVIVLGALLFLALRTRGVWVRWLGRLPTPFGDRLSGLLSRFFYGLDEARRGRALLPAMAWLLLGWVCAWVQFQVYLRMYGVQGSLAVSLFGLGVIALGGAVPSSPGAVGVIELAGVAGLMFLGYGREVALGTVVAAHVVQYSTTVVLGSIAMAREGHSLGDLARAARRLVVRTDGGAA